MSSSSRRAPVLAVGALLAVALLGPAATFAARDSIAALFAPQPRLDPADAAGSPLDVRRAAFGQQDTRMTLALSTQGAWQTRDLLTSGRRLCLVLDREAAPRLAGRLCVGPLQHVTVLRFQSIGVDGRPGRWRRIDASVSRPDARSVRASFAPSALGLALGPFTWSLETRWRDRAACPQDCADRLPDSGGFDGSVAILAQPPCFAAAARDRLHPCRNPALRFAAVPSPDDAQLWDNSPCRAVRERHRSALLHPCAFGVTGAEHSGTIALIGDSHAAMWRASIEVVAQARRWRGVSISRPGCPFSTQVPASPDLGPAACEQLHREAFAWLRAHPAVHTIFVANWAQPASGPMGGSAAYGGGAGAFGAMLDRVPRSVLRIYVLRDIPGTTVGTALCVQAFRARHLPLAGACTTSRAAALTPDPGATAAASRGPRVRVIDLTRFFCGADRCAAVIGGGYVYKDDNHMNAVFATSLGPFVLRALGG